jgi:hypothetical protein
MDLPLLVDLSLLLFSSPLPSIMSPPIRSISELVLLTFRVLLGEPLEALVVLAHLLHEITILVEWHLYPLGDQ